MKVVRVLPVRNEADVLGANLRWYAERGIETVAIDDGSDDGSSEILEEAVRSGQVSRLETRTRTERVQWAEVLQQGLGLAERERPDVLMLTAADEFFEVGDGSELRTAIEEDLRAGSTVFEFKNIEFHITDADVSSEDDVLLRMRHYAHREVEMYRAFRWMPGVDIVRHLGHRPVLPDSMEWRLSPRLYVSRHYPLRSPEQAERKIARIKPPPGKPDESTHYLRLSYGDQGPFVPREFLTRYEDDHNWVLEEKALRWRLAETTAALSRAHARIEQLEAEDRRSG